MIRYHVNWPGPNDPYHLFNPAENGIRTGYYNVTGVPHMQVDGIIDAGGYSQYWANINSRTGIDSPMDIDLSGVFNEAQAQGTLDVSVTANQDVTAEGLFLRIALIENDLYYNAPNGANWHHQTMRIMLPYSTGTYMEIANGETLDYSFDFTCYDPIVPMNCEIIAFVQSDQTREIQQAARIPLTAFSPVSVADENELPDKFYLAPNYPNPFNAGTVLEYAIGKTGYVELSIYNITGTKVKSLVNGMVEPGMHNVIWDGTNDIGDMVSSGVYLYKISVDGKSSARKMVLVK